MLASTLAVALLSSQPWTISAGGALIWGGQPYLPAGLRIEGTVAEVERAHSLGAKEVLVELPASGRGWNEVLEALEQKGMTYVVAIDSMAPMAQGVRIEPENLRITGITETRRVDLALPSGQHALIVTADRRDGSLVTTERVPITEGVLRATVTNNSGLEMVALIYPQQSSLPYVDFGQRMDRHRDSLVRTLSQIKPGPGLRGILNPLGTIPRYPAAEPQFVPTDPWFRMELESFLRRKYTTVNAALRSWMISGPTFTEFGDLARLVPLWTRSRGVGALWDPKDDSVYPVDQRRSTPWRDLWEAMALVGSQRTARITEMLQRTWNVPILQEWSGWWGPYAGSASPLSGIASGMGGATIDAQLENVSRASATLSAWRKPGLQWVTDHVLQADVPGEIVGQAARDAVSLGVRGFYAQTADPAAFGAWQTAVRSALTSASMGSRPSLVAYPEGSANPASVRMLPGGRWWVPGSGEGDRLDLGPNYAGYRYQGEGRSYFALWSTIGPVRTKIRTNDPAAAIFRTLDGTDPKPKVAKNGIIELDLTSTPLLIEGLDQAPVPVDAFDAVVADLKTFFQIGGNAIPNADQEIVRMGDNMDAFAAAPGEAMREIQRIFARVGTHMSSFLWIEAESTANHSFSEAIQVPGVSNDGVLRLRTEIPSDIAPRTAQWMVRAKVPGLHSLWIAARIPVDQLDTVVAQVGDRVLRISEPALSYYGGGFAWYRLGEFQLNQEPAELLLDVRSRRPSDLDLDAVVLTPGDFRPDAVRMPIRVPRP